MKKGNTFYLVHVADTSDQYVKCLTKRDVLDYTKMRSEITSQGPIGEIITVQVTGEWEIEQVALLVPMVEEDYPTDVPCEDVNCQVTGPHTTYNCKNVPRKGGMKWKDIDTTPRTCTNSKCAMPLASREEKCMRSSCQKYK